MPYSFTQVAAPGGVDTFGVPFGYLTRAHVTVKLGGVLDSSFEWVSSTVIRTSTVPAAGVVVEVRRTTPLTEPVTDYEDGSTLVEADLDASTLQNLYAVQEAADTAASALRRVSVGTFDAGGVRITNVAAPVDAGDAATRGYVDGAMSPVLIEMDAELAAARSAAEASELAQGLSEAAQVQSEAARDTANAHMTTAEAARGAAVDAQLAAETALGQFNGIYYGPLASDPVADPAGGALGEGDIYWNTAAKLMRVYNGSEWKAATPGLSVSGLSDVSISNPAVGDFLQFDGSLWWNVQLETFKAGMIMMWSGSIASIPVGWALCDGASGRPDLRNRFLVGAGNSYAVGATGGSNSHTHSLSGIGVTVNNHTLSAAEMPSHDHAPEYHRFVVNVGTPWANGVYAGGGGGGQAVKTTVAGGGGSHGHTASAAGGQADGSDSRPLYYALAFIIKT